MRLKSIVVCCVVFFFTNCTLSLAQTDIYEQYNNVIPPDPISAQFQKYLGHSVSHATGTPDISVPLYTMQASGVQIPFSLKYDATGIKVNQAVGIIGYGWSLYPGFKITRTIMGSPDDVSPTKDIDYAQAIGDREYLMRLIPHQIGDDRFGDYGQNVDGQYDIFSIHLPTVNATFILLWENNQLIAKTIPESPIKITPILEGNKPGDFYAFDVTDQNGIVYRFGRTSPGTGEYLTEWNAVGTTSWMLREIDPPGTNNNISFSYSNNSTDGIKPMSESRTVYSGNTIVAEGIDQSCLGFGLAGDISGRATKLNDPYAAFTDLEYYSSVLNTITSSSGETLKLKYNIVAGTVKRLSEIEAYDQNANLVKTISFTVSDKQLVGVSIQGSGSYSFTYNEETIPHTHTRGQDFSGYYNGKENLYLIPNYSTYIINSGVQNIGYADRSTDEAKMQWRILKTITYPTGGTSSFEYEAHRYYDDNTGTTKKGLGLRVTKIKTTDPVSNKTMNKTYVYGEDGSGLGHRSNPELDVEAFVTKVYHYYGYASCCTNVVDEVYEKTISGRSKYPNYSLNVPVWYSEVKEYIGTEDDNIGSTTYNFQYEPTEFLPENDDEGNLEYYKFNILRLGGAPRLISKKINNESGDLIREFDYTYFFNSSSNDLAEGIITSADEYYYRKLTTGCGIYPFMVQGNDYSSYLNDPYEIDKYYIRERIHQIKSETMTEHLDGQEFTTTTSFEYNSSPYAYNQLSKTITTSTDEDLIEKYYYPVGEEVPDIDQLTTNQEDMLDVLRTKNYTTALIEKEVFRGQDPISKVLYGYGEWHNEIFKPETIYSKSGSGDIEPRLYIDEYDNKGNILQVEGTDGIITSYIWGYQQTVPVAKLINATYGSIPSANISDIQSKSNLDDDHCKDNTTATCNEKNLRTALHDLRNESSLSQAIITAYTYDPLVGMTSQISPEGILSYYEYDESGKLYQVKDQNRYVLSQNTYHLVSDPEPEPIRRIIEFRFDGYAVGEIDFDLAPIGQPYYYSERQFQICNAANSNENLQISSIGFNTNNSSPHFSLVNNSSTAVLVPDACVDITARFLSDDANDIAGYKTAELVVSSDKTDGSASLVFSGILEQ